MVLSRCGSLPSVPEINLGRVGCYCGETSDYPLVRQPEEVHHSLSVWSERRATRCHGELYDRLRAGRSESRRYVEVETPDVALAAAHPEPHCQLAVVGFGQELLRTVDQAGGSISLTGPAPQPSGFYHVDVPQPAWDGSESTLLLIGERRQLDKRDR